MNGLQSKSPKAIISMVLIAVAVIAFVGPITNAKAAEAPVATTIQKEQDPLSIPADQLALLLKPLTKDELIVEADAWRDKLKEKVNEISQNEIAAKTKKEEINKASEKADQAKDEAEEVKKEADETKKEPEIAAAQADEVKQKEEQAAQKEQEAEEAQKRAEQETKAKADLLEQLIILREERTSIIDRFNTVLAELKLKGGDIAAYELYISAVSGITVDVTDTSAVWTAIKGWSTSSEGGIRWAVNIAKFIAALIFFWILSRIVGKAVRKSLGYYRKMSDLLCDFIERTSVRAVLLVGAMVAVTMLEVNIGPILAVIGAAGFVIGFALQGTLSNFASGLMILAYRPFDVGSAIEVAGISGSVDSMNLVSTQIKTWDNRRVIVPNNAIWGDVITNITGLPTRRVDMTFGIGYEDDIEKAKAVLEGILRDHEKVLKDPEPVVRLHELADSSLNFICRPWVNTSDYWAVYWDVTRAAKEKFDEAGISIPFPQRDVHLFQESNGA
jgi:small conductance mechanosensitive channel